MGSLSFENVFRDELEQVEVSRRLRLDESPPRRPPRDSLIGLAFSGGGIRSATFNLGVIQALARARLLRYFDYISTVSGGGYTQWFDEAYFENYRALGETAGAAASAAFSEEVHRLLAREPDPTQKTGPHGWAK